MSLSNFRELLLRKTANTPELQDVIEWMGEELLQGLVIESLEKNDKAQDHLHFWSGHRHFEEDEALYDAINHHVSHSVAADKSGHRDVSNKHMKHALHMISLLSLVKGSHDHHMQVDAPSLQPWQRAAVSEKGEPLATKPNGQVKTVLKGHHDTRSKPDLYLRQNAHDTRHHETTERGEYPLEKIKFNMSDGSMRHIHIDPSMADPSKEGSFVAHAYDNHPVLQHAFKTEKHYSDKDGNYDGQVREDVMHSYRAFTKNKSYKDWCVNHDSKKQVDPAYANRGKEPSPAPYHSFTQSDLDSGAQERPAAKPTPVSATSDTDMPAESMKLNLETQALFDKIMQNKEK